MSHKFRPANAHHEYSANCKRLIKQGYIPVTEFVPKPRFYPNFIFTTVCIGSVRIAQIKHSVQTGKTRYFLWNAFMNREVSRDHFFKVTLKEIREIMR